MKKEIKAMDIDLVEPVKIGRVAYYRLTTEMKEFLSRCNEVGILGFEFLDGSYYFGVIIKKDNK